MTVLHPADIAQEIIQFPFFKSFDRNLLLQVSTLVREKTFNSGEVLIKAHQNNSRLYFLRTGVLEVQVEGEKVAEIKKHGEVIGEMSILSGVPATASIIAQIPGSCFYIEAEDFHNVMPNQRDRFQFLLHKIYTTVLNERLIKTNEKAKLYEITARQLAQKQRELEMVSHAQLNFLRAQSENQRKTVLCLDSQKKQINILKTAIGSAGMNFIGALSVEELHHALTQPIDIVIIDESMLPMTQILREYGFKGEYIFLTQSQSNFSYVDSMNMANTWMTRNPEDKASTIKSVLTALTKIIHKTYFGLEKYLTWGTEIHELKVKNSSERSQLIEVLQNDLKSLGIRSSLLDRIQLVTEELLMNAIYDAPIDSEGHALFNHLPRTQPVLLSANQYSDLRFGCDGHVVAVSVTDPFGALNPSLIFKYLESCQNHQAGELNKTMGKGGAGRGLHQIVQSSDWTIFNLEKNHRTEVIAVFELDKKEEVPPQLQLFKVA